MDVKLTMQASCGILSGCVGHTRDIARLMAGCRFPGERILMEGSVGSGKSEFSRAFVREVYQDEGVTVPSPTYVLQNVYDDVEGPEIHHYDLYRLEKGGLGVLELERSFETAVTLVEWADRLTELESAFCHLRIHFYHLEQILNKDSQFAEWKDDLCEANKTETRLLYMNAQGKKHSTVLTDIMKHLGHPPDSTALIKLPVAFGDRLEA